MVQQWLYVDPQDGPTSEYLPLLTRLFSNAKICESYSKLAQSVFDQAQNIVYYFSPQGQGQLYEQLQQQRKQEITSLTEAGVHCVWFVPEIFDINQDFDWIGRCTNLLIVAPGQHSFGSQFQPWVCWQQWLQDAANVYREPGVKQYIDTLDPEIPKQKLFDVLLGGLRPYRTLLNDWISNDPVLSTQSIVTYYGGESQTTKIILEPGMDLVVDQGFHTGKNINFLGATTRFAVIPPVSVYKQTAYTVVTETNAQHNWCFFTEKIARAMVCKRLFVAFAGPRYLQGLQESGFQTFSDVIDESYDLEIDDTTRWRRAFEQMQALATMNQQQVLNHIRPMVEHNCRVLLETDWHKKMSQQVGQILQSRFKS